ncbi:MAG: poly(R)-hydroxyalkanoic acid synthase subunit PhaE [Actinomycetota bacterium]
MFSGQAEVARAWVEGQRTAWEAWAAVWTPPSAANATGQPMGQWAQAALKALEVLGEEVAPVAEGVAQGALSAQRRLASFLEMSVRVWSGMAEHGARPESWLRSLDPSGVDGSAGPWLSPTALSDLGKLWGIQVEELWKLSAPWIEALRLDPEQLRGVAAGDHSALVRFADVYWDAYERSFGRLLESPSMGYTREFNQRLVQTFNAWLEFRRASFEYQAALNDAWTRTLDEVMHDLGALAERGKVITSFRDLLTLWSETSDRVVIEVFSSPEYARLQGRVLNAAMAYRLRERETVDLFLKMSHVPTRAEVEQASREIHELRRELRQLRRAVKAGGGNRPTGGEGPPKPEPGKPASITATETSSKKASKAEGASKPRRKPATAKGGDTTRRSEADAAAAPERPGGAESGIRAELDVPGPTARKREGRYEP